MKANELMIGDLVIDAEFEERPRVDVIECIEPNRVMLRHSVLYTPIEFIKPIPLTEEILEKKGFIRLCGQYALPVAEGEGVMVNIFSNLADYPNNNGTMLVNIKHLYTEAKIAITYVHELQQALRLCVSLNRNNWNIYGKKE